MSCDESIKTWNKGFDVRITYGVDWILLFYGSEWRSERRKQRSNMKYFVNVFGRYRAI